jgi:hypothetical protein
VHQQHAEVQRQRNHRLELGIRLSIFPYFSRDVARTLAKIAFMGIATQFSQFPFVDPQILTLDTRQSKSIACTAFSSNDTRFGCLLKML